MKNLAKRVGSVLLAGFVVHGAMVACSGGESSSTAQAGTGGSSSTGGGTASTGSGSCVCAQPTVIDVDVKDFEKLPTGAQYQTWFATLNIPGRSAASMLGTFAYGVPAKTLADPFGDGLSWPYKELEVFYRGDGVGVTTGAAIMANQQPADYKSVRFVVPAAQ